ncbi:unnamed protein product [Microthlaspi erraticum]|uniref:DUF4219 domain-containing protein n=1 Tax=Microthlaspi erraticum TaxID=1685480 RepID=A0A6D2JBT8_9BRAS|nr:unnamed protein product [Microthlaspi erraticum]
MPSSVLCPMLNSSNYSVWSMRMKVTLKVHKVWESIDPGSTDEVKKNNATALLFQSIPESLTLQVGDQDSPKGIWDAIKSRHVGADRVREARLQTLMAEFERLTMQDTDTIDSFSDKLSEIVSKSASLGQTIEESKVVKKFLHSLPHDRFIHIIASLEQVLDLNATTYEDIVGRLKAFEERILGKETTTTQAQGSLLFVKSEPQENNGSSGGQEGGRGRGRGSRGRGRGRGNAQDRKKDRPDVICFRCDKPGHFASVFPERIKKLQELNKVETEEEEGEALYVHEMVVLNEENLMPKKYETEKGEEGIWYLDNGASNHMTGVRSFFSELNENVKGKVKFGDGSCVDIGGKGSILFQGKTGVENLLTDIYFIPELKSNILSLGQATEYACDVRMREDYLTLHDPSGILLISVKRSPNRLYKINLKTGKSSCLQSRIELEEEGEEHQEAKDSIEWIKADLINKSKTWMFVDKPVRVKGNGLKWVFKIKRNTDGSINKHKARLVFKVLTQDSRCWDTKLEVLTQAPRCWNTKLDQILKGMKFVELRSFKTIKTMYVHVRDILTKALARIKFKKMRSLIRVQDFSKSDLKLKGVNVG